MSIVRQPINRLRRVIKQVVSPRSGRTKTLKNFATNPDVMRGAIIDAISSRGGEVAARNRAALVAAEYMTLCEDGRHGFFTILTDEFGVDRHAVDDLIGEFGETQDRSSVEQRLRVALEPERELLFRRFISVDDGLAFVVGLRADLLALNDPKFSEIDDELRRLLDRWFDAGLLTLTQITWDSQASLLEKLVEYEAVHAVTSWGDLKNRLRSDRRLYAFQHPGLPNDLLIFVEIALVTGLADSIDELLDTNTPVIDSTEADTAIFYSISNCQRGLAGVRLGDFLIKRVVTELSREQHGLNNFATLSPIPGFRRWLEAAIQQPAFLHLNEAETTAIEAALENADRDLEAKTVQQLQVTLPQLCAHYLLSEKRGQRALGSGSQFPFKQWRPRRTNRFWCQ